MNVRYNASWTVLEFTEDEVDDLNKLITLWEEKLAFDPPKSKKKVERPLTPLDVRNPVWFAYLTHGTRVRIYNFRRTQKGYQILVPSGLLSLILKENWATNKVSRHLRVVDRILKEKMPKMDFERVKQSPLEMKDYQEEAVKEILSSPRGFIVAPPGSGKTFMGIAVILASPPTSKILWLTHTKSLQKQSSERIAKFVTEPVGLIGEGYEDTTKRITVGMFQTLYRRITEGDQRFIDYIRSVDVLFVDEAHHLGADTFYFVTQQATRAYARIALTATPYRDFTPENLFLWGAISANIIEAEAPTVPVELVVYDMSGTVKGSPPSFPRDGQKLFNWEYENSIVRNPYRNRIIALEAIVNRPALILVTRIQHGELIHKEIQELSQKYKLNIKSVFLHGIHPGEVRVQAMKMIDAGELDIAILSDIGKEGLDVTNIKTVILAAGQKSKVAVIQRAGRGLRPKKYGKVRIVDFLDDGEIVRKHSLKRIKTMKSELDVRWETRRRWRDGITALLYRLGHTKPLYETPSSLEGNPRLKL